MNHLKSLFLIVAIALSSGLCAQEGETEETGSQADQNLQGEPTLQVFSKFDFVPGEQVIFFDDFTTENVGDFPARWNTNGSGEIVSLGGMPGRWLKMQTGGAFYPETGKAFPENFTFEFDLVTTFENDPGCFEIDLYQILPDQAIDGLVPGTGGGALKLDPYNLSVFNWKEGSYGEISNSIDNEFHRLHKNKKVRVSVSVQKQRMRMYLDATKIFDIPRFFPAGIAIDRIRFALWGCEVEGYQPFISNFRIAAGAPDMRNKLVTEGKLVTRGITFDSGSDRIKAESNGTLKEIAAVLKENPSMRIKITGHTDSDGDDASNMTLSKKRAEAVKAALSGQFGIETARMETDGKGESQAVSPNTTPEGKANNRRVEFVKL
jgi:outer membrane protein OmpA-like peptidoglycan-associated protein